MASTVEGKAYEEFQNLVAPVHVDRRDFNAILSEEAGGWDAGKLKRAYAGLLESYKTAGPAPADWGELGHLVAGYRPIAIYGMAMRWQKDDARGGGMRRNARNEASAGFAIDTYDEHLVEDNATEHFGPRGDKEDRAKAQSAGHVDKAGKITERGWKILNADIEKLERNAMRWLRKNFPSVRDEGHDSHGDLAGTVWFDPDNKEQAETIEMGTDERIDMVDASYGDLSDTVWEGVSDLGVSVLGGAIHFYDREG